MGEIADYYAELYQAEEPWVAEPEDSPLDDLLALCDEELVRRVRILYRASKELTGQPDEYDKLAQNICNHYQLVGYITEKQKRSLCQYIIHFPRRLF